MFVWFVLFLKNCEISYSNKTPWHIPTYLVRKQLQADSSHSGFRGEMVGG